MVAEAITEAGTMEVTMAGGIMVDGISADGAGMVGGIIADGVGAEAGTMDLAGGGGTAAGTGSAKA